MSVLVGVDAGASHTETVVTDEALRELARRRGAPGAVRPGDAPAAAAAIAAAVREALDALPEPATVAALVAGAAGAARDAERQALEDALGRALGLSSGKVGVTTDAAIALAAAFHGGPGIIVIAGTGSIAYARDPGGLFWRVGGLGWQFGDDGSGYAVGRAALAAVGRAADGRAPSTALSARLGPAAGAASLEDLVAWSLTATPAQVAALARTVCDAARDGDAQARALVGQAAADLAQHVAALLPRFSAGDRVPVATSGGLLRPGSPVRAAFAERVRRELPQAELVEAPIDPALGAAELAAQLSQ